MSLPGKHDGQHAHQGSSTCTVYEMLTFVYILYTLLCDDPVPSLADHYQLKLVHTLRVIELSWTTSFLCTKHQELR